MGYAIYLLGYFKSSLFLFYSMFLNISSSSARSAKSCLCSTSSFSCKLSIRSAHFSNACFALTFCVLAAASRNSHTRVSIVLSSNALFSTNIFSPGAISQESLIVSSILSTKSFLSIDIQKDNKYPNFLMDFAFYCKLLSIFWLFVPLCI